MTPASGVAPPFGGQGRRLRAIAEHRSKSFRFKQVRRDGFLLALDEVLQFLEIVRPTKAVEEFRAVMTRFLSWGAISSLMSLSSQSLISDMRRQDPSEVARAADVRRAWARYADEAAAATRGAIRNAEMRSMTMNG